MDNEKQGDDREAVTIPLLPDERVTVRDFKNGGTKRITYMDWLLKEKRRIEANGGAAEVRMDGCRVYLARTEKAGRGDEA